MVADDQTNFLYLADCLPRKYPDFYVAFEKVLNRCSINFDFIPDTKDIWAVDFMPIQVKKGEFINFVYYPDYLREFAKWKKTISDVDAICKLLHIDARPSDIVLDGGNVVRSASKVIMCDKVFKENPTCKRSALIKDLEELFGVDQLIFIPTDPEDIIGHADGMVRFYNEDSVIINRYPPQAKDLGLQVRSALNKAGLKVIEIPYNPYGNKKRLQANGIYINYLEMHNAIIIPIFDIKEDEPVVKQFEELFSNKKIATVGSNSIADDGGVLNCITWNILV